MSAKKKASQSSNLQRQNKRFRSCAQHFPGAYPDEHDAVGRALLSVSSYVKRSVCEDIRDHATSTAATNSSTAPFAMGKELSIEEALERVAVWKIRSPRTGHAIESTAALTQILYREAVETADNTTATLSTTELRHAYACVVLRSINGLADTLQQQRSMASSVAVLCAELGVPAWLVAIRHEATHNQLPPLVTLRMAANSLLQYFSTVYWEPMTQRRRDASQQAWELLQKYDQATIDLKPSGIKRPRPSRDEKDDASSDSSSDGCSDNEALVCVNGLWQSAPGTTSNRFSLLLDRKAKPKGANVASPIQAVVPVDKNPVVRPVAVPDTTANAGFLVAEQYVQLRVPIDVAYQVAVDYLIGRHDKPGVLVVGNFDETKERFRPLLCVLGRHWPGFLSALLIACVDVVCRWAELDQNAKRSPPSSQCNYDAYGETLVLWIRHLLSRKLLSKIHNWKGKKSGDASVDRCGVDGMASLPVLQTMQFPLNRLCDRVVQANAKQDTRPNKLMTASSAQLVDLFCQILGPHRIENYGAGVGSGGDMDEQWQEPVLFVQPSKVAAPSRLVETDSAAPVSTSLSLEDMEAMLLMTGDSITKAACPTKSQDGHAKINSTLTSPGAIRWVQCQTWEPCAIGCLL